VLVVLTLSLGAAVLVGPRPLPWESGPSPRTEALADPSERDHPPAGVDASDAPLGAPLPAPAEGGAYGFVNVQPDGSTPVAFDPCRPIHYVVRPDNAPPGGDVVLRAALDRVSAVTGLQFVDDGVTDEPAGEERASFQPDRYGDRWAPVLISWNTVAEVPTLEGDIIGAAGSSWRSLGSGPRVYVTGAVSLDAAQLGDLLGRRDGLHEAQAVVLHELAHLVGLDHVDDPAQLMYPEAQDGVTDFGAGDLTGLAVLGSGPCVPTL
jgi:hypothetical protein